MFFLLPPNLTRLGFLCPGSKSLTLNAGGMWDYVTAEESGAAAGASITQGKPALNSNDAPQKPLNTRPLGFQQRFTLCVASQLFRAALKGAPMTQSLSREQGDLNLTPRPCAGNKTQMHQPLVVVLLCFCDTRSLSFLSSR